MEKQWKNHNVSLQQLAQTIEGSYSRRNLKIKETVLKDGYSIRVILAKLRASGTMSIIMRGTPDDFTIETKRERADDAVKVGLMTTIFGGGSIILSSIKSREELEKLEREFWGTIEEVISRLANSAT